MAGLSTVPGRCAAKSRRYRTRCQSRRFHLVPNDTGVGFQGGRGCRSPSAAEQQGQGSRAGRALRPAHRRERGGVPQAKDRRQVRFLAHLTLLLVGRHRFGGPPAQNLPVPKKRGSVGRSYNRARARVLLHLSAVAIPTDVLQFTSGEKTYRRLRFRNGSD